ncbi:MAG: TetR/AcrR family transcriptional regulator [Actinomycetota bacterium]|nr:TetR/AcrR family transcriptional regulator [Actinomycetota bacterium]
MHPTKGQQTRRRIVEVSAPVFNRLGYVGSSMRDLIDATGLEKGGIYNHFGSKEQLALEAYDHSMNLVENSLARSQEGDKSGYERLVALVHAFAASARKPVIDGGCPIMNTAIEADDTHPELRDRARHSMNNWHRLIGRRVKDGITDGTIAAGTDPYQLASVLTSSLEGALMLTRLFDDPAHMDRVVAHVLDHLHTLRPSPRNESKEA